jgi:hypothetical protein
MGQDFLPGKSDLIGPGGGSDLVDVAESHESTVAVRFVDFMGEQLCVATRG